MEPDRPARTPLKVAIMTFGAVVLIGTIIAFAVFGTGGHLDNAEARGERFGQGIGAFGGVCAAIAYLVQRNRLKRG